MVSASKERRLSRGDTARKPGDDGNERNGASYLPDDGPIEVRPILYGSYAIVDMAFDVLALPDRLSIERVAFCGVELGGVVGIWLAAYVPEGSSSLVVGSTSAHYGDHGGPWLDRAWLVKIAGTAGMAADVVTGWFQPGVGGDAPEAVKQAVQMVTKTMEEGSVECCIALAS